MPEQISFKVIKEGGQNRFLKVKHGEEEKEIDLKGKEMDALKGEIVVIFRLEKDKVLFKDVNGEFCYDIPCQEVAFEGLDVVFDQPENDNFPRQTSKADSSYRVMPADVSTPSSSLQGEVSAEHVESSLEVEFSPKHAASSAGNKSKSCGIS